MIFVRDKGRMCNNILQYGHVYAWAREHGQRAISMRFAYKYRYFHICHNLFLKYKHEIISLFTFDKSIATKTAAMMQANSRPTSIKLGIHVRRGDYKTWQGGKYYYSDEQYADVIQRFASLHNDNDVDVYICGNAPDLSGIKERAESEHVRIHCPYGNPAEDLYMLSVCDYIIGAPSTFSLVASMYHDTPLYWMMSDKEDIRFDFFNNMFKHII